MPRKAKHVSLADDRPASGGVAAADRAFTLLNAFSAEKPICTLSELALHTRLYKSTVLRLLASLQHAQLVQRLDDGRYALGSEVARLHHVYTASFSLEDIVLPVLRVLVAATGESAAYHVVQGTGVSQRRLCLYRVDSPNPVRDHIRAGDLLPMDRGTGARVLQAYADVPATEIDGTTLAHHAAIRQRGYCAAVGDRLPEIAGISAPVFKAGGKLAAALTLTMPAARYSEDHIAPLLAAARELGQRLGQAAQPFKPVPVWAAAPPP